MLFLLVLFVLFVLGVVSRGVSCGMSRALERDAFVCCADMAAADVTSRNKECSIIVSYFV